jgi:hypothetical protein
MSMVSQWAENGGTVPGVRPPFAAGNRLAVRHGVRSKAEVQARADEIRADLGARFPILGDDMFADAFERCVMAQAMASLLSDYIFDVVQGDKQAYHADPNHPTTGIEGVPPHLVEQWNKAATLAQKCAQDCGMDPKGFAVLSKELSWAKHLAGKGGLSALVTAGRETQAGAGSDR